jgi:hypothetical protein
MEIIIGASVRRDAHLAWLKAQYAAVGYHNPKEMPPDPLREASLTRSTSPKVAEEIREIRRRIKVAYDTSKARGRNGS